MPLLHDGEVRGVIELGSLGQFSKQQLDLLDHASSSVGLAISAAETRARIQQLLEESQAQGEELTSQQEELRQVNDTLAGTDAGARVTEGEPSGDRDGSPAEGRRARAREPVQVRVPRQHVARAADAAQQLADPREAARRQQAKATSRRSRSSTRGRSTGAGNDLLTLINDILDLSKIEAGKVDLNLEPVAIARLLRNARAALRAARRREGARAPRSPWTATRPRRSTTDPQRLQQILTNLLSNALKFTERGGRRCARCR